MLSPADFTEIFLKWLIHYQKKKYLACISASPPDHLVLQDFFFRDVFLSPLYGGSRAPLFHIAPFGAQRRLTKQITAHALPT